MNKVL